MPHAQNGLEKQSLWSGDLRVALLLRVFGRERDERVWDGGTALQQAIHGGQMPGTRG